ncbi:MAG: chorismate mutase [Lautropia sp.]
MSNQASPAPARTLAQVREDVAALDRQIVALLGQRALLADEAVAHKASVEDVVDPRLRDGLLQRVAAWAAASGTPEALARGVYTAILEYGVRRQVDLFLSRTRPAGTARD